MTDIQTLTELARTRLALADPDLYVAGKALGHA
jgi:hypothetical protein